MQFIKLPKNKTLKGTEKGNSKLTENQVQTIRASSLTSKVLAESFGVSKGCIDGIRSGKTWKHLK